MNPARRRTLSALAAFGLPTAAWSAATAIRSDSLRIARRWRTGNRTLAPLACLGPRLAFAGEERIGVVATDDAGGSWTAAHGIGSALVFRPRIDSDTIVCGGAAGIGAWALADGAPRWRYAAIRQAGTPLVHGGRVFLGDGHEIVALDIATGDVLWRFAAVSGTVASYAPAGAADLVFAGPGDGRLYALRASDGSARWTLDRSDEWQYLRQLHVSGDLLVAGSYKEKLYGIGLERGDVRWEFAAGNFINSHHVAAGTAYLWSPTGWVFAVDAATGTPRWRHRTSDYRGATRNWGPMMAELVTAGGELFALTLDNAVHVLDIATGDERRRLQLPEPVRPFVLPMEGGRLAFASAPGEILLSDAP